MLKLGKLLQLPAWIKCSIIRAMDIISECWQAKRCWPAGKFAPRVWNGSWPRRSPGDPSVRPNTWSSDRRCWCSSAQQQGTRRTHRQCGDTLIARNPLSLPRMYMWWSSPKFFQFDLYRERRSVCAAGEPRSRSSRNPATRVCPGQQKPNARREKDLQRVVFKELKHKRHWNRTISCVHG